MIFVRNGIMNTKQWWPQGLHISILPPLQHIFLATTPLFLLHTYIRQYLRECYRQSRAPDFKSSTLQMTPYQHAKNGLGLISIPKKIDIEIDIRRHSWSVMTGWLGLVPRGHCWTSEVSTACLEEVWCWCPCSSMLWRSHSHPSRKTESSAAMQKSTTSSILLACEEVILGLPNKWMREVILWWVLFCLSQNFSCWLGDQNWRLDVQCLREGWVSKCFIAVTSARALWAPISFWQLYKPLSCSTIDYNLVSQIQGHACKALLHIPSLVPCRVGSPAIFILYVVWHGKSRLLHFHLP